MNKIKVNVGFFISKFFRFINRPALRNCSMDKTSKVGTGSNCIDVVMGRYSYMGKNCSVCNTKIGSFCSIASYCSIGGGTHDMKGVSTSPIFCEGRNVFRKNFATNKLDLYEPVSIGNDVWIGEKVFIKDGITIHDGAIIGAHSVVTHDVPPYAVVVGAPAKVIRYRFNEDEINKLLSIEWWKFSDDKLMSMSKKFSSIDSFFYGEVNV